MSVSPGSAARRTRRAYSSQDLCSVHACLEALQGVWDRVTPESHEDITCERVRPELWRYSQVKTVESPGPAWSIASVTRPEQVGIISTSILGRLFTAKPIPDHAAFELVTNERVAADLWPLCENANVGEPAREASRAAIVKRLQGLEPAGGRSTEWCVQRLQQRAGHLSQSSNRWRNGSMIVRWTASGRRRGRLSPTGAVTSENPT
jgi:hypothetical protein